MVRILYLNKKLNFIKKDKWKTNKYKNELRFSRFLNISNQLLIKLVYYSIIYIKKIIL